MKERENQYDVLRILSLILVVFIHASADGKNLFQQLILTFAGCAVPIFFMLSGSFVLNSQKTLHNPLNYYKAKIIKILIPTLIAAIMYLLAEILICLKQNPDELFYECFINHILSWGKIGIPGNGWHLWFMRVIILFYAVAPLLILFREKNSKLYILIFCISALFSILNFYIFNISLPWFISWIFYLPLIVFGDIIKNYMPKSKFTLLLFVIAIILKCFEYYMKASILTGNGNDLYRNLLNDGSRTDIVVDPQNFQIFNLLASMLLFYCFKNISVKKNRSNFAELCFYIYLIHYELEGIIGGILLKLSSSMHLTLFEDSWYWLLLRGSTVLVVSLFIVVLCKKIHQYLASIIAKK